MRGVEGGSALRVGVVVVVAEVACAVVVPATGRVNKSRRIQLLDACGQLDLGVVVCDLAPAFIVDDLESNQ